VNEQEEFVSEPTRIQAQTAALPAQFRTACVGYRLDNELHDLVAAAA
jgi:hypothetical protein